VTKAVGGDVPPALRPLLEEPTNSAVLTDFDGTLAPIVPDPDTARPLPGAAAVLGELSRSFGVVAVVSGRPVPFLAAHLGAAGPRLRLFGGYGMEWLEDGVRHRDPAVEPWTRPLAEVAAAAVAQAPPGVGVEDKGYAVTLHWRRSPDQATWGEQFAREWAGRTGLVLQPGRMAVEVRPPVGPDKGAVVARLARGRRAACFAGDDAGDLAAFAALDVLEGEGVQVAKMAVADLESPRQLLSAADLVVHGPAEAMAVLEALAAGAVLGR
jgi:trehalose 6-phosphate phosphatase